MSTFRDIRVYARTSLTLWCAVLKHGVYHVSIPGDRNAAVSNPRKGQSEGAREGREGQDPSTNDGDPHAWRHAATSRANRQASRQTHPPDTCADRSGQCDEAANGKNHQHDYRHDAAAHDRDRPIASPIRLDTHTGKTDSIQGHDRRRPRLVLPIHES